MGMAFLPACLYSCQATFEVCVESFGQFERIGVDDLFGEGRHASKEQRHERGSQLLRAIRVRPTRRGDRDSVAALARLRPRDREVLVLRHLEQLSIRDIAAVLGISEGAVKTRHLRALQRLRRLLGDDWSEGTS